MPEGYLHISVAMEAAARAGVPITSLESFKAGANGPDPLFFYKIWKLRGKGDMYALSQRLHREKTGQFLVELARRGAASVCRCYAMGFAAHYAADLVFHPYVAAMTEAKNAPYGMQGGHSYFETDLDSYFHKKKTHSFYVPREDSTANLTRSAKTWIASQLGSSIDAVYSVNLPQKMYEQCFDHMWAVRGGLSSLKSDAIPFVKLIEKSTLHAPGFISGHMQPGTPLPDLPAIWKNPYTEEVETAGPDELFERAVQLSERFISALDKYYKRQRTKEELAAVFGNRSYDTGLEIK